MTVKNSFSFPINFGLTRFAFIIVFVIVLFGKICRFSIYVSIKLLHFANRGIIFRVSAIRLIILL